MVKAALAILAASLVLAGCANTRVSDRDIKDSTALALNQPASAIIIADRRDDDMNNTRYTAWTPQGTYSCMISGGTVMPVGTKNQPQCSHQ